MKTITIVHDLLTVPLKPYYVFKRSPEIMDWFATLGYGFHDRYDSKEPYALILYEREKRSDFGFSNSTIANDCMTRGRDLPDDYFDITPLIEARLFNLTYPKVYEYW